MICEHCGRDVTPTKEGSCSYCSAPLKTQMHTSIEDEEDIMSEEDRMIQDQFYQHLGKVWHREREHFYEEAWFQLGAGLIVVTALWGVMAFSGNMAGLLENLYKFFIWLGSLGGLLH